MAIRRKKKVPAVRRTGLAAAPTDSYRWFAHYVRLEVDKKEIAGILRNYIRNNFEGDELKFLLSGPEWVYTSKYDTAAIIEWGINRGQDVPAGYSIDKVAENFISEVGYWCQKKIDDNQNTEEDVKPKVRQLTPLERTQRVGRQLIAEIEGMLDEYDKHESSEIYDKLVSDQVSAVGAQMVIKYYEPLKAELEELVNKKTPDLVEAYSNMSVKERQRCLSWVTSLISDTEKYVLSKKATRAVRKPRVKAADKQVTKLNYLKASKEYKLTSIHARSIVGAMRLYTFNTKYKTITEYVSSSRTGFEVKGSTLQKVDIEQSRQTSLRKPEVSLSVFQSKTVRQIDKHWASLTTKTKVPNARINKDTILLRVMNA
jgi:hypothetical protein